MSRADITSAHVMQLYLDQVNSVCPPGLTGHTEVVRVVFSPKDISLEELLKRFWENHDPTQGSSTHGHTHTNAKKTQKSPSNKTRPEGHGVY